MGPRHLDKIDYSAVQTLLALDNRVVRTGLRQAFTQAGFDGFAFTEASDQGAFLGATDTSSFDLIIASAELGGFFIPPLLGAMRDGRLDHSPFPIIILLLAEGDPEYVRKAGNAGADHMMLLPVAPGPMLKRLDDFVVSRRPWVVTMDYVGPDRRKGLRPGTEQIPLIDVPNPMAASIRRTPADVRQSEIALTKIQLNTLKLERFVAQFRWLDTMIGTMFRQNDVDAAKLESFAKGMKKIAGVLPFYYGDNYEDIEYRMGGFIADMAASADALLRHGPAIDPSRLDKALGDIRALADEIQRLL
jgi:DNA-binding response OmpR family regulator